MRIMDRLVHLTLKETVLVQHTVLEAVEVLIFSYSVEVLITTMITLRQMKMKTLFKHQVDGATPNHHQPPILTTSTPTSVTAMNNAEQEVQHQVDQLIPAEEILRKRS